MQSVRVREVAIALCVLAPLGSSGAGAGTGTGATERLVKRVQPAELVGTWSGELDMQALCDLELGIVESASGELLAYVAGAGVRETNIPIAADDGRLRFQPAKFPIFFDGWHADGAVEAFVQHGQAIFHVRLPSNAASSARTWAGRWSSTDVPGGRFEVDLYIVQEGDTAYGAYLFFRDPRMPSLWTHGFECDDDAIRFREKNLGLSFEGGFERSADALHLRATAVGGSTTMVLQRTTTNVFRHSDRFLEGGDLAGVLQARPGDAAPYEANAPVDLADGWPVGAPAAHGIDAARIRKLVDAIVRQDLTLTHSVLIARHGTLVVEEYFYGFDADIRHDMRSASKTVAAALAGAAIDRGMLPTVEARVLDYLSHYRRLDNWDVRKPHITMHDVLHMASGLDANDYDPDAAASENAYQSQAGQPDWVRFVLDAPMIADPGTQPLYGGANPLLVGGVLQAVVGRSVESFAHELLFGPLGIADYKWFLDPSGRVYMGGGMYMRPRDMLKLGQMHLNGGTWAGQRVLSEDWVQRSMAKYGHLANVRDKNEYGYLWWHRDYEVDGQNVASIEARGAGGQYIFVVPSLDLVAVVTSGNYRNGRFRQPEEILQRYILPAAMQASAQR